MPTSPIIQQKTCAKCAETKLAKYFYRCPANADGLTVNCRRCRKPMISNQTVYGEHKSCSVCGLRKPLSEFGTSPKLGSGHTSHCLLCGRARWRKRNPIRADRIPTTLPGEEWRPVVGFEDEFSVSNLGRVRRDKGMKRTFANRLLVQNLAKIGYFTVALHGTTTLVHRLVASAFLEPEPNRPQVNHKNGIRTENRVENLEWVTHTENMAHAAGILQRSGTRRLTPSDVRAARVRFAQGGITRTALAKQYGVAVGTISKAIDRIWWKHVQ